MGCVLARSSPGARTESAAIAMRWSAPSPWKNPSASAYDVRITCAILPRLRLIRVVPSVRPVRRD